MRSTLAGTLPSYCTAPASSTTQIDTERSDTSIPVKYFVAISPLGDAFCRSG